MNDTESVTRRGVIGSERRRIDAEFHEFGGNYSEIVEWPRMEDDEFNERARQLQAEISNDGHFEPSLSCDF